MPTATSPHWKSGWSRNHATSSDEKILRFIPPSSSSRARSSDGPKPKSAHRWNSSENRMFCLIGWDSPLIFVQFDQPLRIKYTLHIEAFISGRPKVQSIVEGIGVMWLFGSKSCACSTFWVAFDHAPSINIKMLLSILLLLFQLSLYVRVYSVSTVFSQQIQDNIISVTCSPSNMLESDNRELASL